MTWAELVAVVLFLGVLLYAVLGGADFGSGFWDLVAGGAERGAGPRRVIDHAIGPVWEANHVWLVFVLVVLWTGFPEAFASITLTLWIPLFLSAVGIVLRGSSFAFRRVVDTTGSQRVLGATFALSSVLVPFCMGTIAGGIASGRVPPEGTAGDVWGAWLNPTSILGGVLAVVVCAYLAAVYLVCDAARLDEPAVDAYFRRRAEVAAVVAGVVSVVGIFVLRRDAEYLFGNLTGRGLPLIVVSVMAGVSTLVLLTRGRHALARAGAVLAVAAIVAGWGVSQWPYILPESLTVDAAAAPEATLVTLTIVTVVAVLVVVPSLFLLFWLDQRSLLDDIDSTVGRSVTPAEPAE